MVISPELLLAALGIAATVIGWFTYVGKRSADARVLALQVQLSNSQAELETAKSHALTEVDESKRANRLMDFLEAVTRERQQAHGAEMELRQRYIDEMTATRDQDERNYKSLVAVMDGHTAEVTGAITSSTAFLDRMIQGIPDRVGGELAGNMAAMFQTIVQELASTIRQELGQYPETPHDFPAMDDAWREVILKPISSEVRLRRSAHYSDQTALMHPNAMIQPEGAKVFVLTGAKEGWIAVHRPANGHSPTWGWVPTYTVTISPVSEGRTTEA